MGVPLLYKGGVKYGKVRLSDAVLELQLVDPRTDELVNVWSDDMIQRVDATKGMASFVVDTRALEERSYVARLYVSKAGELLVDDFRLVVRR